MTSKKEMQKQLQKQLKEYKIYLDKEARDFRLTGDDLAHLYDIFYMIDFGTLRINKMSDWAESFMNKLEPIVIQEIIPIESLEKQDARKRK